MEEKQDGRGGYARDVAHRTPKRSTAVAYMVIGVLMAVFAGWRLTLYPSLWPPQWTTPWPPAWSQVLFLGAGIGWVVLGIVHFRRARST